jgi:hypothetical protein
MSFNTLEVYELHEDLEFNHLDPRISFVMKNLPPFAQ